MNKLTFGQASKQIPTSPYHSLAPLWIQRRAFSADANVSARLSIRPGTRSAHRFLQEGADLRLFGGGQLLEREGDRPQGSFVEVGRVVEAQRGVSRVELLGALE